MKSHKLIISFALTVLAVSCEQEPEGPCLVEGEQSVIGIRTSDIALGYELETKASMETMKTDGFGLFVWNTGSKAFDEAKDTPLFENLKLTYSDGGWSYTGDKAVWDLNSSDNHTFAAYHPYSEDQDTKILNLQQPSEIDDCIDYLAAKALIDQTPQESIELKFEHIFTKVTTQIKLATSYEGQSYTLKSITFSDVMTYPSYSLTQNSFNGTASGHTISSTSDNINNPTMSRTGDIVTVDPIYICPYAYLSNGKGIIVTLNIRYDYNDGSSTTAETLTRTAVLSKDIEGNKDYTLTIVFTPEEEFDSTPINLSENGNANCYIATKKANYYFDATYKGQSTTETVGEISSVEVLWESANEGVAPGDLIQNLTAEGNIISFMATGKKGNALIAAKDAENNILWSWHIWMTDQPEIEEYTQGYLFLDRNLGAVSANIDDGTKTYGLYYQYGRKDPFVGPDIDASTSRFDIVETQQTIDLAILNPTTLSFNYNTFFETNWDLQNPCPPGYTVPRKGDWGANSSDYTIGTIRQIGGKYYWKPSGSAEGEGLHPPTGVLVEDGYIFRPGDQGLYLTSSYESSLKYAWIKKWSTTTLDNKLLHLYGSGSIRCRRIQ